jgi:hypothetical protein
MRCVQPLFAAPTIEPSGRFVPWLTTVKKSAVNQIF